VGRGEGSKRRRKMSLKRGFSLIEALVALLLLLIIAVAAGDALLFSNLMLRRNAEAFCLQNAASSGLEYARANPDGDKELVVRCKDMEVLVSVSGVPAEGECGEVSAVATYRGRSFTLTDWFCRP